VISYLHAMETALENPSKEDLLKVISSRDEKINYLESQIVMYKRIQFGQKRECFEGDSNQTMLPFGAEPAEVAQNQEVIKEKMNMYINVLITKDVLNFQLIFL
jgi:transposase